MIFKVIVLVYTTLSLVNADLCNPLATLVETETFYLTQPYSKNISLDLSNYEQAFKEISEKVALFNQNLKQYDDETELIEKESVIPFSEDFNAFKIPEEVTGAASFDACSKRNGSIVTLTNENRNLIVKALNSLEMEKTPFRALPFFSLLSLPDYSHIEKPNQEFLYPLWAVSPPFITKQNVIEYPHAKKKIPDDYSTSTEAGVSPPTHIATTIDDYKSQVLCLKENNPWDWSHDRSKWLELIPQIKQAAKLLIRVKDSFMNSKRFLHSLPQATKAEALKLFKLVLPDPLKSILNFLDKFSRKSNWDKTNLKSKEAFSTFTKEASKLARFFNLRPQSIAKISNKKPTFQLSEFQHTNWLELLQLNDEHHGISGPITIIPQTSLRDANPSSRDDQPSLRDALELEVTANLHVFDRRTDKVTLYSVRPNNYKGYFTTVKTVLQNNNYITASVEEIKPSECHTQPSELHPICNKLPFHSTPSHSFADLAACGNALSNSKPSEDFWLCPYQSVLTEPYIYRAHCDDNGQSTTIINSKQPLTLEFFCDSEHKLTRNFSAFPSSVKTECEVRTVTSGQSKVALPQNSKDFLLNPTIEDISTPEPPTPPILDTEWKLILTITIPIASILILSISITLYCCCKRKSHTLPRTLSQNQIRELKAYNEYPMLSQR